MVGLCQENAKKKEEEEEHVMIVRLKPFSGATIIMVITINNIIMVWVMLAHNQPLTCSAALSSRSNFRNQ